MRFSLLTLFLVVLWCATAMLVYFRWEAWDHTPYVVKSDAGRALYRRYEAVHNVESRNPFDAPDGRRVFDGHDGAAYVRERFIERDGPIYHRMLFAVIGWHDWTENRDVDGALAARPGDPFGFLDDDTLLFLSKGDSENAGSVENEWVVFYRRHPEWWWGHFYRPELWALLVLTVLMGLNLWKGYRAAMQQRVEAYDFGAFK